MKSYNMKSFLLIVLLGISSISAAQNLLDLSGNWELALDSTDVGEKEGWYLKSFSDNISLPGTTDLARKGTSNRLVPKLEKTQLLRLTRKNAYGTSVRLIFPKVWQDSRWSSLLKESCGRAVYGLTEKKWRVHRKA